MSKPKPAQAVTRRRVQTQDLHRIDLGDGVYLYTNTQGVPVSIEYDKGDGVIVRKTVTT